MEIQEREGDHDGLTKSPIDHEIHIRETKTEIKWMDALYISFVTLIIIEGMRRDKMRQMDKNILTKIINENYILKVSPYIF